jgi:hypothetical protein
LKTGKPLRLAENRSWFFTREIIEKRRIKKT